MRAGHDSLGLFWTPDQYALVDLKHKSIRATFPGVNEPVNGCTLFEILELYPSNLVGEHHYLVPAAR